MTKNLKNQTVRSKSKSDDAEKDWVHTSCAAKMKPRTAVAPMTTRMMETRLEVYSSAPARPARFLTDMYTGRKAVVSMPATTSS